MSYTNLKRKTCQILNWMGYISGLVIGISTGYIVLSSGKFDHWFSQWAVRRMWYKLNARLRGRRN